MTEFFIAYKIVMSLAGFVFFALVIHRLCMKGTSKKLRQKVIIRHVTWYVFFLYLSVINTIIITNTSIAWGIFPYVTDKSMHYATDMSGFFNTETIICGVYYLCGIMLAVVRFAEPFVFKTFKAELPKCIKCSKKNRPKKNKAHNSHTLC